MAPGAGCVLGPLALRQPPAQRRPVAGPGPLVADGRAVRRRRGGPGQRAGERRRALAELLLERYGIVTREQVLAENVRGGFAALYDTFNNLETLGVCRRGYFIEGMGGPSSRSRERSSACAREPARESTLVIAATDPAQPYGAALPWPKREREQGRPARVAGAYLVLVNEEPALYLERGGRSLLTLIDPHAGAGALAGAFAEQGGPLRAALEALAEAVRDGQAAARLAGADRRRAGDGQPAGRAADRARLPSGPRRLTLSADERGASQPAPPGRAQGGGPHRAGQHARQLRRRPAPRRRHDRARRAQRAPRRRAGRCSWPTTTRTCTRACPSACTRRSSTSPGPSLRGHRAGRGHQAARLRATGARRAAGSSS